MLRNKTVHLRTSKRLFLSSSVSWVSVSFPGLLSIVPAAISSPLKGEWGSRHTWEANGEKQPYRDTEFNIQMINPGNSSRELSSFLGGIQSVKMAGVKLFLTLERKWRGQWTFALKTCHVL